MNTNALSKIGYGLYVLISREGDKDNGCIINTVNQLTSNPCQIGVAVNKQNYTCGMIERTRKLNISILTENTNFMLFKTFGYQSGASINKFEEFPFVERSPNGLFYLTKSSNSYLSAYVQQMIDLGSHILFIAQLVSAEILNEEPTVTYDFYQKNIKQTTANSISKGWRCKICGYIYEKEILPPDYICPICKHGAIDFEKN
jgi:flavin reductase (DIM6/NTAB) family NADH-FMN oxidoreductase RutF